MRNIANRPRYHHFCPENHQFLEMDCCRHCAGPNSLITRQPFPLLYWSFTIYCAWKGKWKVEWAEKGENWQIDDHFCDRPSFSQNGAENWRFLTRTTTVACFKNDPQPSSMITSYWQFLFSPYGCSTEREGDHNNHSCWHYDLLGVTTREEK